MSSEDNLEFFVCREKLGLITERDRLRGLKEMFGVRITVSTSGQKEGEWISASGTGEGPRQAKEYIQAQCNPECVREESLCPERLALCRNLTEELEKEFLVCVTYGRDHVRLQGGEVKVILALSKIQEIVGADGHPNGLGADGAVSYTEQLADKEKWTAQSGSHPNGPKTKTENKVKGFVALGFEENAVRRVIEKYGPQLSEDELMTKIFQMKKEAPVPRTPIAEELTTPPPLVNSVDQRLRPVIIDGSNVAMSHGKGDVFSCEGIRIVVEFFQKRGHTEVIAMVPAWRKERKPDNRIRSQHILSKLEQAGSLCFTPSRKTVDNKRITPYDDNFIVQSAHAKGGVIVSNDNYRDIMAAHPEWKETIEQRLLLYMFMGDLFMLAEDPAGKNGPHVDEILRIPRARPSGGPTAKKVCPHGKKCTFGNRCRFYHPNKECPNGRKCTQGAKCPFFHPEEDGVATVPEDGKTATTPAVVPDMPTVSVATPTRSSEGGGYYSSYPHPQTLTLAAEHLTPVQGRGTMAASPVHYRGNTVMPYQSSPSISSPYSMEQDSPLLFRNLPGHPYGPHTFPQYQRIHPEQNMTTYSNPVQPYYSTPRLANNGEMLHLMSPQYTRDSVHLQQQQQQQLYEMLTSILRGKDRVIQQVMRENPHLTEKDLATLVRLCQDRC